MSTSHLSPSIVTRSALLIAATVATLALAAITINFSKPASALECVRAPHTVTVSPDTASQSGTPGTTLSYNLEITNNDSAGCGQSEFTFDGANIPADWTVSPYQGTEVVDAQETTAYTLSYTSGSGTYNGSYTYDVEVFRAEEPTLVKVPVTYTVVGGQDVPPVDTAPYVTITSPAADSTVTTGTTVTIAANVSDERGITHVEFLVNGNPLCSGTATSCQWNVPATAGTYQLQVRAQDTTGNVTTRSISVNAVTPVLADTTAPTLTITSPAANATVKKASIVAITAAATDNVGVTKIEFYVNNTLLCSGTATTCNWAVPNARASYQLTVKAYDAANNVTAKSITVSAR